MVNHSISELDAMLMEYCCEASLIKFVSFGNPQPVLIIWTDRGQSLRRVLSFKVLRLMAFKTPKSSPWWPGRSNVVY